MRLIRQTPTQQEIADARARGVPWKTLQAETGLSRTHLWRIWRGLGSRDVRRENVPGTSWRLHRAAGAGER